MLSRPEFERCLVLHLEKVQVGTVRKAKGATGDAWRMIVDHLYQKNAPRMDAIISLVVLNECSTAILELLKSVRPVHYLSGD
jgi:hypothetical protein